MNKNYFSYSIAEFLLYHNRSLQEFEGQEQFHYIALQKLKKLAKSMKIQYRSRRTNSDLEGIKILRNKNITSNKCVMNQSYSGCKNGSIEQKFSVKSESTQNPDIKKIDIALSLTPHPKTTNPSPDTLLQKTYQILKHFFTNPPTPLSQYSQSFLLKIKHSIVCLSTSSLSPSPSLSPSLSMAGCPLSKKLFVENVNKLPYIEQEMRKKQWDQVDQWVIKEWRKNCVLYAIRAEWYEKMGEVVKEIGESGARQWYTMFKDAVGHLAMIYFGGFYERNGGNGKEREKILNILVKHMSHNIITSTSTWKKLYNEKLLPLFANSSPSFSPSCISTLSLSLPQLIPNPLLFSPLQAQQISSVSLTQCFKSFIIESNLRQKILLLQKLRKCLQKQMKDRQQNLGKKGVFDKDDYVDVLVWALIGMAMEKQGKWERINKIGAAVKTMQFMLGDQLSSVLSKYKCQVYLIDLQVAYNFIKQKLTQTNNKQQQDKMCQSKTTAASPKKSPIKKIFSTPSTQPSQKSISTQGSNRKQNKNPDILKQTQSIYETVTNANSNQSVSLENIDININLASSQKMGLDLKLCKQAQSQGQNQGEGLNQLHEQRGKQKQKQKKKRFALTSLKLF